jgi:hypothetical protein
MPQRWLMFPVNPKVSTGPVSRSGRFGSVAFGSSSIKASVAVLFESTDGHIEQQPERGISQLSGATFFLSSVPPLGSDRVEPVGLVSQSVGIRQRLPEPLFCLSYSKTHWAAMLVLTLSRVTTCRRFSGPINRTVNLFHDHSFHRGPKLSKPMYIVQHWQSTESEDLSIPHVKFACDDDNIFPIIADHAH